MNKITFGSHITMVPTNQIGFVYMVTQISSGKKYVGLKHFFCKRNGKVSESDWRTYTTSSNEIKALSKKNMNDFKWDILCLCNDEPVLKLKEVEYILSFKTIDPKYGFNQNLKINIMRQIKDMDKRYTLHNKE